MDLKKFLQKKKVLKQFEKNAKSTAVEMLKLHGPEHVILKAFNWSASDEGLDFWYDINDEWINLNN